MRIPGTRRPSTAQRDAAVQLLVECLRAHEELDPARAADLVAAATAETILEAAAYHGVAGVAHVRLRHVAGLPPALVAGLKDSYESSLGHHLRIMWELAAIRPALDESGARWAVIKGPVAAELLYDSPAERTYGDLDVLVAPTQFDRALDSLQRHGSRLLDRNWETIRRELRGEVHFQMPGGSLLDLHWNLVNIYRGRIRVDTMGMLERAQSVELGGLSVPTLDNTDTLLHLALHGTLSGGDKLLWMSDIANACRRRPPNWDALVARAEAWHIGGPVGFMLSRSVAVLGAEAPEWVADRLLGRRYQRLMAIADRLSPWQRTGGRLRTPGLMLARSMGFDLLGATRWLLTRTLRSFDPREPAASDTFTARGDMSDYHAFVRAVVASTTPGTERPST